jgi:hypothetical protein
MKPDYKSEFGLSFGDNVEAFNPIAEKKTNDVRMPRTEPCIALYPSANKNGSWVMYNLNTKSYVCCTQWKKLPTSQLIVNIMSELAGERGIMHEDVMIKGDVVGDETTYDVITPTRRPPGNQETIPTAEEILACDQELEEDLPELCPQGYDNDSESESEDADSVASDDDDGDEDDLAELLESITDSEASSAVEAQPSVPIRKKSRSTAGVKRLDELYEWNLMNLSLGAAIRNFGETARDACRAELLQLFQEKKALHPVKISELTPAQMRIII